MRFVLAFLFIATSSYLWGQELQRSPCGTRISTEQSQLLKEAIINKMSSRSAARSSGETVRKIAVTAHILQRDDGSGGITPKQINDELAAVNRYYIHSNLNFFLLTVNEIEDSDHFNFEMQNEQELGEENDIANTINIYFANSVVSDSDTYLCGYTYLPMEGHPDRIIIDNDCATTGNTLTHEIGHFFSLLHTHGKDNGLLTDELVDGSNCETAGDEICDTPADPKLSLDNVNDACIYIGTLRDTHGNFFNPDPTNIMSYSLKACRDSITNGQYERVSIGYETFRTYLHSKQILAEFSSSDSGVCEGESVAFAGKSINATSLSWYFEGGTPATSNSRQPEVAYHRAGNYDVRLIAHGADDNDTLLMEDYVEVWPGLATDVREVVASFEESPPLERILNSDGKLTFEQTVESAVDGEKSMTINFYDYTDQGAEDYLLLSSVNSQKSNDYKLSFDYAYAPYSEDFFDKLAVVYRTVACEDVWQTIWEKEGMHLATTSVSNERFRPSSRDEWKSEAVIFSVPDSVQYFEVAFKTVNGYGNNLYLDNVQLSLNPLYSIYTKEVMCHGGETGRISIVADDPEAGYQYSLDGENYSDDSVFTDLPAGDYTVYIMDLSGTVHSEEIEIPQPDPIEIMVETVCNDFKEDEHHELQDIYFHISPTSTAQGPWYLIEEDDTLFFGIDPVVYLAPGSHSIQVVDSATGCSALSRFDITILDKLNVMLPEPQPGADYASLFLDLKYRGPGDSLRFRISGRSEWHLLSDTIKNLEIGTEGSIEVKDLDTSLETCSLWGYFRSTESGFITIEKKDAACGSGGEIIVSNAEDEVYDPENFPYLYSIDGAHFTPSAEFNHLAAGEYLVYVYDNYGDLDPELTDSYRTKRVKINAHNPFTIQAEVFCEGPIYNATFQPSNIAASEGPWTYVLDDTLTLDSGYVSGLEAGSHRITIENLSSGCEVTRDFQVTTIDSLGVSIVNPTQHGQHGQVVPTVHFQGHADSLEYRVSAEAYNSDWLAIDDTLSDLPVGDYTLTVRYGGSNYDKCDKTTSFTIKKVPALIVVLGITQPMCNGHFGSVKAEVTHGSGNYMYRLNAGEYVNDNYFDGLAPGNYVLTVKDSENSTLSTPFTVVSPKPMRLDLNIEGPACSDNAGSISISAAGGEDPYTYLFDDDTVMGSTFQDISIREAFTGINNSRSFIGRHTITAFDQNGCSKSVVLQGTYDGSVALLQVNGAACYGFDSIRVSATERNDYLKYTLNDQQAYAGDGSVCNEQAIIEYRLPQPMRLTLDKQDPLCAEGYGRAVVSVSGGTSPFMYRLDGSKFATEHQFTGLRPGSHEVVVKDASGCVSSEIFEIASSSDTAEIDLSVTQPKCPDELGAVTITPSWSGNILFQLNGGDFQEERIFNDLAVGDYTVTARDEYGCEVVAYFGIDPPAKPEVELAVRDVTCQGGADGAIEVLSDVKYQSFYNGNLMEDDLTGLISGTYTFHFTDGNGCQFTEEVVLDYVYEQPMAPAIKVKGDCLVIDETDHLIRWYHNGYLLEEETGTFLKHSDGEYQVSLSAPDGSCEAFSEVYKVPVVATVSGVEEISIFPNPVDDAFTVSVPDLLREHVQSIVVTDLTGKALYETRELHVRLKLPSGMYLVRIIGDNFYTTKKIVKH